jgi:uncharacterized protein YoaH (UPF0181 family)
VTNTVLYSYLFGWIITSVGLALATRGQSRPASVTVAAGAVWPLLVLGAAQWAAIALVAEVVRIRQQGQKSIADELEELLDEWLDGADSDAQLIDLAIGDAVARDRRLSVVTGRDSAH